jgi:uncharacterized membrane protein YhaH (DUF805 family)
MSGYEYFFGASGRFDRTEFWTTTLLFMIAFPIAAFACLIVWYWWAAPGVHRSFGPFMVLMISVLAVGLVTAGAALLAVLAANVKRMHDRGKSGTWVAMFWIVPIALTIFGAYLPAMSQAFSLASAAIALWAIVEMGVLAGKAGTNAYGEDLLNDVWSADLRAFEIRPLAAPRIAPPAAPRSGD